MPQLPRITGWLFVVSSLFPMVAAGLPAGPPRWLGVADVTVAAALAVAVLALSARHKGTGTDAELASGLRLVRAVALVIPLLLVVFFTTGHRVNWEVLVIGLAWRAYLLIMVSPYFAAATTE